MRLHRVLCGQIWLAAAIVTLLTAGCASVQPTLKPQVKPAAQPHQNGGAQSAPAPWTTGWRTAQLTARLEQLTAGKTAAASTPTHAELRLSAAPRDDSALVLHWEYAQQGDYDLNGATNLSDLSVLGAYFGLTSSHMLWPEARRVDGDGNGVLTIADISPIASAYGETLLDFVVEVDDPAGAPPDAAERNGWYHVAQVPLAAGSASVEAAARVYELELANWAEGATYRVTARGEGDGVASEITAASLRGDWWMDHRDAQHTSFSQLTGPSTGHIAWQLELPGAGLNNSSPVVDRAGNVYAGTTLGLACVRPAGQIAWLHFTGSAVVTTPAVGMGGTVYCGTADGRLVAVKATGGELWTYAAGAAPLSAALGADGTVYFGGSDGTIHAVGADGVGRWTYPTAETLHGSPAIDREGNLYFHLRETNGLLKVAPAGSSAEQLDLGMYTEAYDIPLLTHGAGFTFDQADVEVLVFPSYYRGLELVALHPEFDPNSDDFGDASSSAYAAPALGPEGRIVYGTNDGLHVSQDFAPPLTLYDTYIEVSPAVDARGWAFITPGFASGNATTVIGAVTPDGELAWQSYVPAGRSQPALDAGTLYCLQSTHPYGADSDWLIAIGSELNGLPPQAPQNVAAMPASDHSIRLGWQPVNGAATYEIFRDGGANPYAIVPQLSPDNTYKEQLGAGTVKWLDEVVEPGVPYEYTVRAVNRGGVSGFSNAVTGASYLEQPEDVAASDGLYAEHVEVTWTRVANATGYRILRDGPSHVFEVGDVAVFNDTEITDWDTHTYTVVALNDWATSVSTSASSDDGALQRGAGAAAAGDWRSADHDAQGTRRSGVLAPAATPALQWQVDLDYDRFGQLQLGDPLFGADNSIGLPTDETYADYTNFFVLNADGTLRFSLPQFYGTLLGPDAAIYGTGWYPAELRIYNSDGSPRASNPLIVTNTPISDSGTLYSGTTDASSHAVLTSFAHDGGLNWHFDLEGWYPEEHGPVVAPDGTIYIGTRLHPLSNPGSPGGPPDELWRDIYAINPDGSEKWMYPQHGQLDDYVVGPDGTLYVLSVGYYANPAYVRALAPDMSELWTTSLAAVFQHRPGPLCLAADGKLVLFDEWAVLALNPDGSEAWRYPLPWTQTPPFPEKLLLDSAGNACFCVRQGAESYFASISATGDLRWSVPLATENFYSFGLRDDGTLIVASHAQLDAETERTRIAAYR